jgi:hypothetical protein
MEYNEVIENIKTAILSKGNIDLFKNSMVTLKNEYSQELTTEFLKNLSGLVGRKASNRVHYLIKNSGFHTEEEFKLFKEEVSIIINRSVPQHTFKVLTIENDLNEKSKLYSKQQYFKGCGQLAFKEVLQSGFNVDVCMNAQLNNQKVFFKVVVD